jgi:hypothetical protein
VRESLLSTSAWAREREDEMEAERQRLMEAEMEAQWAREWVPDSSG